MPERLTRGEDELDRTAGRDQASVPKPGDRTLGVETPPDAIDLADVLRGVAARLDSVLDERRSEPAENGPLETGLPVERRPAETGARAASDATPERAREAPPSPVQGASQAPAQADRDARDAVVSTLVVRIGTDGSVLGPPRTSGPADSSPPVEATAEPAGDAVRQPEGATQSSPSVQRTEAKRADSVAAPESTPPSQEQAVIQALPDDAPATVAPFAPAHAEVSTEELRSRLEKRRLAVREAESGSATAAPQVRAALIVVRNVLVGVALGVAIAIAVALLG